MKHKRWKLSSAQRADMWTRWKAGESLNAIGRALGKDHVIIQLLLARHGGIAPPARRRSQRALNLAEREDISRGIASGCSMRVIAQRLGRAPSTVSREVARHGGRAQYPANEADLVQLLAVRSRRDCSASESTATTNSRNTTQIASIARWIEEYNHDRPHYGVGTSPLCLFHLPNWELATGPGLTFWFPGPCNRDFATDQMLDSFLNHLARVDQRAVHGRDDNISEGIPLWCLADSAFTTDPRGDRYSDRPISRKERRVVGIR